jgi:hypothetical protein
MKEKTVYTRFAVELMAMNVPCDLPGWEKEMSGYRKTSCGELSLKKQGTPTKVGIPLC